MDIELLINKILENKNESDLEEIRVDLQRLNKLNIEIDSIDRGYVEYLFKHYYDEIQIINNSIINYPLASLLNNKTISTIENIRNYLIKIAVMRICKNNAIQYEIQMLNSINYCLELLN